MKSTEEEALLKMPDPPFGEVVYPEVIPCEVVWFAPVDRLQPSERLANIAATCFHHESFRKGLARVQLPGADDEPKGEAIAVNSPQFRQWLSSRYLAIYGVCAPSAELKSFVSRFDFQLRLGPKATVKRAK